MQKNIPDFFIENQNIKEKTYYKMGGKARYFSIPSNIYEIQQTILWCRSQQLPCAILGSGSNSVYSDEEFQGVILSLENLTKWFWETEECLYAEGGVTNTEIAEICLAANRAGAAWMYRMPGQIGASIRMNARCYGGEVSHIVKNVITIDDFGYLKTYSGQEIFQGYKLTALMHKPEIVVGVRLFFPQKAAAETLLSLMQTCESDRHRKQHFFLPSCGSTFKNNYQVGKPSGQIFDELGLKGYKIGAAEVSQYHANFVWNTGNARTSDMLTLTAIMREKALREKQAHLDLEVQPVGVFSEDLYSKCGMESLGPTYEHITGKKWVGLFYFPNEIVNKVISANQAFPKILFESPFIEYFQTPSQGCVSSFTNLVQLMSLEEAKRNPSKPFLQWKTYVTDNPSKVFPVRVPENLSKKQNTFVDELWQYSVSEIFFAEPEQCEKNYLEFEMTPNGEWVAIEFSGIRQRSSRNTTLTEKLWDTLQIDNQCIHFHNEQEIRYVFGMSFSYKILQKVISEEQQLLAFQCALSLGNSRYYLAPYWKKQETQFCKKKKKIYEKASKPDFHQPKKFWQVKLF